MIPLPILPAWPPRSALASPDLRGLWRDGESFWQASRLRGGQTRGDGNRERAERYCGSETSMLNA
jgi:hypothetical protein